MLKKYMTRISFSNITNRVFIKDLRWKLRTLFKRIFYFLLILWFVLSLARTFYNFSKIATEEKDWLSFSDDQKRSKIFGDLYDFLRFVEVDTRKGSDIIFYMPDLTIDGRLYYLGNYYLYPRRIEITDSLTYLAKRLSNNSIDYVISYYKKNRWDEGELSGLLKKGTVNKKLFKGKINLGSIYTIHE